MGKRRGARPGARSLVNAELGGAEGIRWQAAGTGEGQSPIFCKGLASSKGVFSGIRMIRLRGSLLGYPPPLPELVAGSSGFRGSPALPGRLRSAGSANRPFPLAEKGKSACPRPCGQPGSSVRVEFCPPAEARLPLPIA